MATTTLTVKISGGVASAPITVILTRNGESIATLRTDHSFTHTFNRLYEGDRYALSITGYNPVSHSGKTEITLDTTQIGLYDEMSDDPVIIVKSSDQQKYTYFYSFRVKLL